MDSDHTHDIVKTRYRPYLAVYVVEPGDIGYVPKGVIAGVRLSPFNLPAFNELIPGLLKSDKVFMVFVDQDHEEDIQPLTIALMHVLFSSTYLSVNGYPVIGFICGNSGPGEIDKHGDDKSDPTFDNLIRKKLLMQGYHQIVQWTIEGSEIRAEGSSAPFLFQENVIIESVLHSLFADFQNLTNYVIFQHKNINDRIAQDTKLSAKSFSEIERHPLLQSALASFIQLSEKSATLTTQNTKLNEQLQGATKTIEVIRTKYKDDYENLFAWYHREYEILPLWYKRFGHILKVLMGKRTFRSLFSDEVKKYKD
jgi:hypothetical protein